MYIKIKVHYAAAAAEFAIYVRICVACGGGIASSPTKKQYSTTKPPNNWLEKAFCIRINVIYVYAWYIWDTVYNSF